jgi:hypothetical protein
VKKIFGILFALVLLVGLGLATVVPVLAGTVIHVPDDYPTIQAALNASEDGDTIMVAAGEYDAFGVIEKNDISIIGTEGTTVTGAIYSPAYGYLMAWVAESENINIEGVNFDGTEISGGESVFGIIYLDSTGSIADLTVENFIGTELGAGVAIIDEVGTSIVEITGSTISNNGIGILVLSGSTQEAHFNNIVDNTDYGVRNDGGDTVYATRNWWGDDTGPSGFGPGDGDAVSSNVNFEPWLGAQSVTQRVEDDTVDAIDEADIQVVVTGKATVTIARYASNPYPLSGGAGGGAPSSLNLFAQETYLPLDIWRDVRASNIEPGTEFELRLYYTDAEVTAVDIDEESLRLFWWNGTEWVQCLDSGVDTASINGYSGYMLAIITEDTTPSLADLQGTEFGGYGHPSAIPQPCGCFIATATYDTDRAKEIDILREFRDVVLLPNSLGAKLVSFYYKTSPPVANFISQHEILRTAVRVSFVDPSVKILDWTYNLWSAKAL